MEKKSWVLFLLFCILQGSFCSSSIDQQEKDRIIELPGLSTNLISFAQYSGYVTVNEDSGRNLFYWFIEAVEDPSSKPLVLWLQGGPGCSSIGFGQAEEIGPFHINPDGKTLYINPYSWNQVANILFLESPVGTGFSYSNNASDIVTNGDQRTAEDSLVFLLQWFERFPQYKGSDFYITGESYAGHYIPHLAQAILGHQWPTGARSINFKGYMVGNGLADDYNDHAGVSDFLWTNGVISDTTYELRKTYCHNNSYLHISDECSKVADLVTSELGNIDIYSVFTPSCTRTISSAEKLQKRLYKIGIISPKYDPCTKQYSGIYFNLPEVQKALHVNLGAGPMHWEICSDVLFHTWKDSASSMVNIHRELIASGLRVWIFSGDTDTVIPVTSTRYSINDLQLQTTSPWRPWYNEGQVGGWTQGYSGLNFVTIRGAGHMVPLTKPKLALVLFKSFLSGTAMPLEAPTVRNS